MEVPRIMKIISLSFKIISLLLFLTGLGCLMVSLFMKAVATGNPVPEINTSYVINDLITKNTDKFFLLIILLAILVYMASESFLKFKIWAKYFLEIFSWLGLIFLISTGFFLSRVLTPDLLGDLIKGFKIIMVVAIAMLIIPFILLYFSLGRPTVKKCFSIGDTKIKKKSI